MERIGVKRSGEFSVLSVEEIHAVMRVAESEQDAAIFAVARLRRATHGRATRPALAGRGIRQSPAARQRNYTHRRLGLPKSGKVRSEPLIDQAAKAIDGLSRRELHTGPDDLVFGNPFGAYLGEGDLRRRFYTALRVAGLGGKRLGDKPIVFHDRHHTFSTVAVQVWDLPRRRTWATRTSARPWATSTTSRVTPTLTP